MRLQNIRGFRNIDEYVRDKIQRYDAQEKNFENLFFYMFSERENVMAEVSDGYRIKKLTYGECADKIVAVSAAFARALAGVEKGSIVGLYMNNSIEWIQAFWSLLKCGYSPLLMNARTGSETLEKTLTLYGVAAVISDSKTFGVKTLLSADIFADDKGGDAPDGAWGSEVLFMSSGTSDNIKLCAYTGENFFHQICDSATIIEKCPQIKKHYEGELKILTLLPFYHVFGFIAVYLWFGFFSRTFVFLKDLNPQTLLSTVQKHKVTHIFAVPLVWETVYKKAMRTIQMRGKKTYDKFNKALKLVSKTERIGSALAKAAFKEIRQNMFGESICFLISGGSGISDEALRFFNGIDYHLANGYGMTEIGITSVDISMKRKIRNKGSVGFPFSRTQYAVSEKGELLIKGKTMATRVFQNGEERRTNFDEWFCSRDLVSVKGGRYYIQGRADDLIVCKNGENLNPEILEKQLHIKNADGVCLFNDKNGVPTLLISVGGCYTAEQFQAVLQGAKEALKAAGAEGEIANVALTTDKLLKGDEFKISRRKIAKRYEKGEYVLVDPQKAEEHASLLQSALERELCECFAQALQKQASEIGVNDDFFTDLGGSSLDYFTLMDTVKERFSVEIAVSEEKRMSSVKDIYQFIQSEK